MAGPSNVLNMQQQQQAMYYTGLSSVSLVSGTNSIRDTSFLVPAASLGGAQVYWPQASATSQMGVEVISHPTTGGVAKYKSVSNDLVTKIVSNKFVGLVSLLDPIWDSTMYDMKSLITDEGLMPLSSLLHPKSKPLSVLQCEQAFTKHASAYANHYPNITHDLFTYMFKVLDLASSKWDWAYYDHEFRKDKATSGYSFSAHRVDLYAKTLTREALNYSFCPQKGNSFYGTSHAGQQIPRGYCYGFRIRASTCFNGSQCKFDHKCFLCKSQNHTLHTIVTNQGGGAGDSSQTYSAGKSFQGQSATQKSTLSLPKGKQSNS